MSIPSRIPLIIFSLAFLMIAFLAFPIVKSRYFSSEQNSASKETKEEKYSTPGDNKVTSEDLQEIIDDAEDSDATEDYPAEDLDTEIIIEDNSFLEILPSDCKNGCINFDEAEDIKYCKQYCGLVNSPKTNVACDKLENLEKDYCLKEDAIKNKDGKTCNQIEDDGIKKSCLNRITEDILDAPRTTENNDL